MEDEPAVAVVLGRFLRKQGLDVYLAGTVQEALDCVRRHKLVLMVSDVGLPDGSGVDLVAETLALDPSLAVIMCTGSDDARTAKAALASGALDYLVKPLQFPELRAAVDGALRRREERLGREHLDRMLREEMAHRTVALEQERMAMRAMSVSVAESLITAMEAKDRYLRGHSQRVAELAASIAHELALDEDVVEAVRMAGRLHDVGKIGIHEAILNKPGRLTAEEFDHVKSHVEIGMQILAPLQHLGIVLDFVHDHHEHVDGRGYPRGLAGDQISIGGRILAAADAYDALTSARPYREEPMSQDAALDVIREKVGMLLDPAVFDALCRVLRRRRSLVFLEVVKG